MLSGWRMCQVMRDADQAGRNPASTNCCDITARRRASAIRAGWRLYSCTAQAYRSRSASQTNVASRRQVVVTARHLATQPGFCRVATAANWDRTPVSITGTRVGRSGQRVKNLLHVVILLEFV